METKEKKKKQEFYRSFAEAMDLSWRIAITGTAIAGAIYFLAISCAGKKEKLYLERQQHSEHFYTPSSLETSNGYLSRYKEREDSAIAFGAWLGIVGDKNAL